jgi:hypothetical protein
MTTPFKWFGRLVDKVAKPAANVATEVQLFSLEKAAWIPCGAAASDADGQLRGSGDLPDDTVVLAPALRLVEAGSATVLSGSPRVALSGQRPLLNVDFGELVLLAPADRFVQPRAATRLARDDPATIGAVVMSTKTVAPALDVGAAVAAATDDAVKVFTVRLAESAKAIDERDAALASEKSLRLEREKSLAETARQLAESQVTIAALRGAAATASATAADGASSVKGVSSDAVINSQIVGVGDLAVKIGTDLVGAQAALKSSGFSLGGISVNARGVMQGDGSQLNLLDIAELKTLPIGVLSDVRLDFKPDTNVSSGEGGIPVPDVAQLTETAARRVLASVGLVLDATYGPLVFNGNAAEGQAMLQTPAAGVGAPRGAHVLVVFARGTGG